MEYSYREHINEIEQLYEAGKYETLQRYFNTNNNIKRYILELFIINDKEAEVKKLLDTADLEVLNMKRFEQNVLESAIEHKNEDIIALIKTKLQALQGQQGGYRKRSRKSRSKSRSRKSRSRTSRRR